MAEQFAIRLEEHGIIGRVDDLLPIELQHKFLMKAIRTATRKFQQKAKKNVQRLKAAKRPRWGKVSPEPLKKSIRRRAYTRGTYQSIGSIKVTGRAIRLYAAPVEYGHEMWIYGQRSEGDVQEYQFWRPTIEELTPQINKLILDELRKFARKYGHGKATWL